MKMGEVYTVAGGIVLLSSAMAFAAEAKVRMSDLPPGFQAAVLRAPRPEAEFCHRPIQPGDVPDGEVRCP